MAHEAFKELGAGVRFKMVDGKKVRLVKKYKGSTRSYKWVLPEKYHRRSPEQVFQGGLGE